eukprot:CAMPEP_0172612640 /NCGR_PEP_ID=MMETSP1068-20121228/35163_1 /TAXON_ID=35684 /ORGANISM="Pseudopedinella elastica, Strain CCMP716" /LENGTH=85 /DNA_ID=CAMNT_0013416847 /DNA_START=1 /DNA_END=255 /DNA_ORIENTATION=+
MRRRAAENKEAKVDLSSVSRTRTQAKGEHKKKQHDARLANPHLRTFTAADRANKSAESTPQVQQTATGFWDLSKKGKVAMGGDLN